jgi:hypothetical protein
MRNLYALLTLAVLVLPAAAQERPVYRVQSLEGGPVKVDGQLDEGVWQQPPTFELAYEVRPAENTPSPVRTEVWITYDSSNLYAAFRAHDPEPGSIRARYSDRDAATNDDYVGLVLDTFNDQRRAFEFFANPFGVQMDMMQNEMTGAEDASWDAIWDSAGRITATGYDVEMRIPLSSLRFPPAAGEMTWGIDVYRNYPRGQSYRFGLVPISRGNNCYLCQNAALTGFGGVRPARSIELHPTVTSSLYGERDDLGRFENGGANTEAGLTGQWGITPNFILSGTINPDFSQVEADAAQLTVNTNFALFYPEKRPFFLEGADLFDTRFQAIYSRNIADPEWGAKLTGKSGKNAFGAIVSMDRQTNFLVPTGEESKFFSAERKNLSTILRYRRDLFGATTGGFFYTGREGEDGYHNRMLGGDILFRWRQTKAFRLELMGSSTQYPEDIAAAAEERSDAFTGHGLRAVYQHTSANWMYYILYRDVAKGFRADLGFVPRADFRDRGVALERAWYPEKRGWSQVRIGTDAVDTENQDGGHLETRANVYAWAQGPRQSFLRVDVTAADQTYHGGRFDTDRVTLYGEVQAHPDVFVYAQTIIGSQIDFEEPQQGEQVRFDPGVRWNAGEHLRLNLGHFYETLDVDSGRLFTANLTELRATYQFNNRTFVRWIGQHLDVARDDSHSRDVFNQLLFSYKINPFTVLFAGYSDTWVGAERIDLMQQNRTLFLKVGYAWQV